MTVTERFFALLQSSKTSQKEFADISGIPTSTISAWKKRNTDIPSSYLSTIADFFNISLRFLLTGENSAENNVHVDNLVVEENELLNTYRKLDSRGQHKIHTVIYEELDRIKAETQNVAKKNFQTDTEANHSISKMARNNNLVRK